MLIRIFSICLIALFLGYSINEFLISESISMIWGLVIILTAEFLNGAVIQTIENVSKHD